MRLKSLFPVGACKGTTEKGQQCRVRDIHENGYCKHHGGAGMLVRAKIALEKSRRLAERHQRRMKRILKNNPTAAELIEKFKARYEQERQTRLRGKESQGLAVPVQAAPQKQAL